MRKTLDVSKWTGDKDFITLVGIPDSVAFQLSAPLINFNKLAEAQKAEKIKPGDEGYFEALVKKYPDIQKFDTVTLINYENSYVYYSVDRKAHSFVANDQPVEFTLEYWENVREFYPELFQAVYLACIEFQTEYKLKKKTVKESLKQ
jgi:hypothetical protein